MKYIFGPVNSRRFGISLGVDIIPFKTCTLDCVYCECGATTLLTTELKEYTPVKHIIKELDDYLSAAPRLDVITFSGGGEPTLHSGLGEIIEHLKKKYPQYDIAVLTNSTMMSRSSVRSALMKSHIVVPSLDAATGTVFEEILRPHKDIEPEDIIKNLILFSNEFQGKLIIEIFIVPGINDSAPELAQIKKACLRIKHDAVFINSLDRPGTDVRAAPLSDERLKYISEYFSPLKVLSPGKPSSAAGKNSGKNKINRMIISTLKRRPSTVDDLVIASGFKKSEILEILRRLEKEGVVIKEKLKRGDFYRMR